MGPGLQHRFPVGFRPAQASVKMRGDIVARHQPQSCGAIDRCHKIPGQHQHGDGVGIECFERPVRHEAQMSEERAVKHRREPGLSEKVDDVIEADAVSYLDFEPGEQSRIGIDAHDAVLHRPVRPPAPIPADQACLPDLRPRRAMLPRKGRPAPIAASCCRRT